MSELVEPCGCRWADEKGTTAAALCAGHARAEIAQLTHDLNVARAELEQARAKCPVCKLPFITIPESLEQELKGNRYSGGEAWCWGRCGLKEVIRKRLVDAPTAPAPSAIIGREVISKPGAALEVTQLELSPEAKAALCAGDARIPPFKDSQPAQGGLAALYGKWPGDETDEEVFAALSEQPAQGDGYFTCQECHRKVTVATGTGTGMICRQCELEKKLSASEAARAELETKYVALKELLKDWDDDIGKVQSDLTAARESLKSERELRERYSLKINILCKQRDAARESEARLREVICDAVRKLTNLHCKTKRDQSRLCMAFDALYVEANRALAPSSKEKP